MNRSWLVILPLLIAVVSCSHRNTEGIPEAPDYAKPEAWFQVDRSGSVDLFYISSTETVDQTAADGTVWHYALAADSSACPGIRGEMEGVDRLLSGDLNFFSPFYRQITMETYADTALIDKRFPVAMDDARRAFRYYIDHLNDGRPFVLAGFSQGAQIVLELLKELPDSLQSRLVAAYVIGWKITEEELASTPSIRPAQRADDTGVTICYNSVREPEDGNPLISGDNVVSINPVNWCTDATPAVLFDTLTVTLDPTSHLLLVDGYEGSDNVLAPLFGDGCYHTFEIRWYSDALRENIAERCRAYLSTLPTNASMTR